MQYLYLIISKQYLKIGYTKDLQQRLNQYFAYNPHCYLDSFVKCCNAKGIETAIMRKFKSEMKNEWHRADLVEDVKEYIKNVFKLDVIEMPNKISRCLPLLQEQ